MHACSSGLQCIGVVWSAAWRGFTDNAEHQRAATINTHARACRACRQGDALADADDGIIDAAGADGNGGGGADDAHAPPPPPPLWLRDRVWVTAAYAWLHRLHVLSLSGVSELTDADLRQLGHKLRDAPLAAVSLSSLPLVTGAGLAAWAGCPRLAAFTVHDCAAFSSAGCGALAAAVAPSLTSLTLRYLPVWSRGHARGARGGGGRRSPMRTGGKEGRGECTGASAQVWHMLQGSRGCLP